MDFILLGLPGEGNHQGGKRATPEIFLPAHHRFVESPAAPWSTGRCGSGRDLLRFRPAQHRGAGNADWYAELFRSPGIT